MSPILGIYASQISGHLSTNNYSSIQTVTVGSGGASSITFSSIPSTYTHLQLRGISRTTYVESDDALLFQFNNDTGSNYSYHRLYGTGSSAGANGTGNSTVGVCGRPTGGSLSSGIFGATVMDILDYANTSKYKTTRTLAGWDGNGSGMFDYESSSWQNTSAITSIKLTMGSGNFDQYSSFALYGVK